MCYGDEARPPLPPAMTATADTCGDLTLTAADGNELMAYAARPDRDSETGIVILPDVRGLHDFYKELARRFAEVGLGAIAIDYFGRTAGIGPRDESFEFRTHVEQTTPEGIDADVTAAIEYLRSDHGGNVHRAFTVGFCFGGSNSWRQSATQPGLAGAIGFYGQPSRVRDWIGQMRAPLLLVVAGQDFTPLAEFQKFDHELADAGVPHEMVVYEDAPHSFFDRTCAEHRAACDDAWRRMLSFVDRESS